MRRPTTTRGSRSRAASTRCSSTIRAAARACTRASRSRAIPTSTRTGRPTTIEYVEDGATKLLEVPVTPADFALRKGGSEAVPPLAADAAGVPIHEYIDLSAAEREGKTPFVWSTDDDKKLVRLEVVARHRPSGRGAAAQLAHPAVARGPRRREARRRASQRDGGAAAAAQGGDGSARDPRSTRSPAPCPSSPPRPRRRRSRPSRRRARRPGRRGCRRRAGRAPAAAPAAATAARRCRYAEEDVDKCSNCKTCYQELPELFEKTRIVVAGEAKEVGHLIAGRARAGEGHAGTQGEDRPRRRQLRLGDHP